MNRYLKILSPIIVSLFCLSISADDWPQFLGPKRNGEASGGKLLEAWPEGGPKKLWSHACGQGFAGVAVKNDLAYLYHRIRTSDIVECLNATNGTRVWKKEFKSVYAGGATADLGPRCVPLINGDSIILYGSGGTLRRLKLADGEEVWSKSLFDLYKANSGYFGGGSAPIIVNDTIVVIVGGRKAGIVGLDLDGKEKWTTAADTASYASPIQLKFKNKDCVACVSKYFLKIVEVSNGNVLAEQEFGKRGPTVNAAAPLLAKDKLFLTAAYNIGGRMISLDSFQTVWENDESMSSQYTTSVYHDGNLYGSAGREDFGNGNLRCVRASDGKVLWSNREAGLCHLIKVGDLGLAWNIKGKLRLFRMSPEKFQLLAETSIFDKNSKSLPALSNGRLFLKSNGDGIGGKLVCLQVGKE